jgi:hypothetical protein
MNKTFLFIILTKQNKTNRIESTIIHYRNKNQKIDKSRRVNERITIYSNVSTSDSFGKFNITSLIAVFVTSSKL